MSPLNLFTIDYSPFTHGSCPVVRVFKIKEHTPIGDSYFITPMKFAKKERLLIYLDCMK